MGCDIAVYEPFIGQLSTMVSVRSKIVEPVQKDMMEILTCCIEMSYDDTSFLKVG